MEVILLFIVSGAVSWGLSALVLLAIVHALGRATANSMGLPYGSKPGVDLPSGGLAPWPAAEPAGARPAASSSGPEARIASAAQGAQAMSNTR